MATAHPTQATGQRKVPGHGVFAVALGNFLEFYDFIVFSFFTVMIARAFFPADAIAAGATPQEAEFLSLLATVATFGAGFVTRPIGAAVMGAYADRAGRKASLTITLGLMAVGTALIAFTPGYAQIGIWAPILLVIGRLIQGFSAGGEVGPATTYLLEAATPDQRAFMTSFQGITQMFAGVLGSGLGLIIASNLSEAELYDWGWRIPFILGLIIAPVGLYVRMALPETLDEAQAHKSGTEVLRVLFTRNWGAIVLAVLCILGPTVSTYVSGYMTTYAIKTLNQPANVGMYVTMCGYIATLAGIPLAAWAADRVGARISVIVPRLVFLAAIIPAYQLIVAPGVTVETLVLTNITLNFLLGLSYGGLYVLITQIFPMAVRSSGLSLAYAISVTVFGGTTQVIVTWLLKELGDPMVPAWYQVATTALSTVAIFLIPAHADVKAPQQN